jgi:uridine kinase
VVGIKPLPISMDNYYLNRVDTPRKADGSYDFEALEAIDIPLFNDHLARLLRGEKVKLPKYDFRSGIQRISWRRNGMGLRAF